MITKLLNVNTVTTLMPSVAENANKTLAFPAIYTLVDEKKIKSAGVAGVMRPGKNSVQVIVGIKVQFVADEMKKMIYEERDKEGME